MSDKKEHRVAVVGATGMVGQVMLKVLEERNFPVGELIPVASERSVGKVIHFRGQEFKVCSMESALEKKPHIALFSAGGETSLIWAPKFAETGTTVIDNSSAWRMSPYHPLVVPEINANTIKDNHLIIANPNCSTIQLVMVLKPLHDRYKVKRVVISTYQSVSGTGVKAVNQMANERKGEQGEMAYPYAIDQNCLPHIDIFLDNDYTKEEMKLTHETKKILGDENIKVTATAVRVPVLGGHSESVNVEMARDFDINQLKKLIHESPGLVLQDQPEANKYPMPRFAADKDEVFVGRVRRDETQNNTLNFWCVTDNLRKGAATNAVQIAEYLLGKRNWH